MSERVVERVVIRNLVLEDVDVEKAKTLAAQIDLHNSGYMAREYTSEAACAVVLMESGDISSLSKGWYFDGPVWEGIEWFDPEEEERIRLASELIGITEDLR